LRGRRRSRSDRRLAQIPPPRPVTRRHHSMSDPRWSNDWAKPQACRPGVAETAPRNGRDDRGPPSHFQGSSKCARDRLRAKGPRARWPARDRQVIPESRGVRKSSIKCVAVSTLTNPPPEVGGFEREPLKAAVIGAAHERLREPPEGGGPTST